MSRPRTPDVLLAIAVVALGQLEVWAGIGVTHRQGPPWVQAASYALVGLALAARRVEPLACLAVVVTLSVAEYVAVGAPEGLGVMLPTLVASYTVGRWEERPRAWWGLVLVAVQWTCWAALDPVSRSSSDRPLTLVWLAPWVIAWLVGALIRATTLATEQRRFLREQRASRAVAEERNRIARELHDVIGHSVSVMTVQVSAVRRRLTPEQSVERDALLSVEDVGRQALAEMRRMVGVLRQDDDRFAREPAPGLDQMDRLVEQYRSAGLPVQVEVVGQERPLAPGLDLTAYRLVQEGLTNALKHADAPTSVRVTLVYGDDGLDVAVRDDGAPGARGSEPGHGLVGMRERVSVYGGRLVSGFLPVRGFELSARLPWEHEATQEVAR